MQTKNKKIVIDTNILISAFVFPYGIIREMINLSIKKQIEIFVSDKILQEYVRILNRKFYWTDEDIKENLKFLSKIVKIIKTNIKVDVIKHDITDNMVIECAITANADFILSGDRHLLNQKKYRSIPILKPSDFMRTILK